jgi:hypothetical protein
MRICHVLDLLTLTLLVGEATCEVNGPWTLGMNPDARSLLQALLRKDFNAFVERGVRHARAGP